jgi:hypothetical protein
MLECDGTDPSEPCREISNTCPDLLFSDGTPRTVEEIAACAVQWASFDCELYLAGEYPPCVVPGLRQPGDACYFASQCSTTCDSTSGCGVCAESDTPSNPEPVIVVAIGEPCEENEQCETGNCAVKPDEDGNVGSGKVCRGYPDVGEDCSGVLSCIPFGGGYCEASDLLCHSGPADGEPCGRDAKLDSAYCAPPLACRMDLDPEPTCRQPPGEGETCAVDLDRSLLICAPGTTCDLDLLVCRLPMDDSEGPVRDLDPDPPTSRPASADSCGTCPDGQQCLCERGLCETRICAIPAQIGEPCEAPDVLCHPATKCVAGTCQPVESQGIFDEVCAAR